MTKPKDGSHRPKLVRIMLHVRTDLPIDKLRSKRAWATVIAASTGWTVERDRIILENLSVQTVSFLDQS